MKIVVILAALLLLIGGGTGAYYFMRGSGSPPPTEAAPPLVEPIYYKLETFVVPIMRGGVVDGFVRLEVTLEVPDSDVRREVERRVPKLRSAMLADLHALVPLRRNNPSGRLSGNDVATIKTRLKKIVDAQFGPGVVRDVLLEEAHDIPPQPGQPKG